MAIGDNYITMADLKSYMSIEGDSYDDRITWVVSAVSRDVEDWCHRQFNQADTPTSRVYKPYGRDNVITDDFLLGSATVETDTANDGTYATTWSDNDFVTLPLNGVRNGVEGWPQWEIEAVGNVHHFLDRRRPFVRVTATWGWLAVPAPVVESCLILGADTFQMKDSRLGIAGSDQFGTVVRVRDSVVAQSKLAHYVFGSVKVG